jgi:hypothetical protein
MSERSPEDVSPLDDLPPAENAAPSGHTRPLPVTLTALYEFAKAVFILFAFQAVWSLHKANVAAGSGDSDPISHDPLVLMLPIFALLLVVAGFGLWAVQPWARHLFLFGGALSLPWLPAIPLKVQMMWGPIFDYHILEPYMPRTVMTAMFLIDLLVYATLVAYPDVAQSFGEPSGDPYYSGDASGL